MSASKKLQKSKVKKGTLTVDTEEHERVPLLLRQDMLSITQGKVRRGGVSTGSGLGSDAILLEWGDKHLLIYGRDILRAWVATIDPEAAKALAGG